MRACAPHNLPAKMGQRAQTEIASHSSRECHMVRSDNRKAELCTPPPAGGGHSAGISLPRHSPAGLELPQHILKSWAQPPPRLASCWGYLHTPSTLAIPLKFPLLGLCCYLPCTEGTIAVSHGPSVVMSNIHSPLSWVGTRRPDM